MKTLRSGPIPAGIVSALVLVALGNLPADAQAVEYQFTPLVTAPGVAINSFHAIYSDPTINNSGVVAYRVRTAPFFSDLVLIDGMNITTIDLNAASGFGGIIDPQRPIINDSGAVAVWVQEVSFGAPARGRVLRINADSTVTILATTNTDGVSGDFQSVELNVAMNNAGQVAAKVFLNSGLRAIILLDDSGQTVIDTEDAAVRFNFTGPAINDAGVVAYKAQETVPNSVGGFASVFAGDGISPVQIGLPLPACGNTFAEPDINNNGLIAGNLPSCLVLGSGGVITEHIVSEATNPFVESIGRLSLNDLDQIVFATSTINGGAGLYFGDDPVNDKLIDTGDTLFGEPVGTPPCCGPEVRFAGEGGFNDHGQVVFIVGTVSESNVPTSYLVRADRDTDSDGLTDNADNCTLVANADQRDTDADGIGNSCDADLDGNCVINFSDLGIMKAEFFTADPDADLDGNGVVNFTDLGIMKAAFFGPPGPSGVDNLCSET